MKQFSPIMMQKCRQIKFLKCVSLLMLRSAKVKRFHRIPDSSKLGVWRIPVSQTCWMRTVRVICFTRSGAERWPNNCSLRFVNGDRLQDRDEIFVGSLLPGEQTNISVNITSPISPRIIRSQWRLFTSTGVPFGGKSKEEFVINKNDYL